MTDQEEPSSSIPSSLPVRSQIGPYLNLMECLLGTGGMGQVYRAVDVRLGRKVAIKLLVFVAAVSFHFVRGSFLAARLGQQRGLDGIQVLSRRLPSRRPLRPRISTRPTS